MMNSTETQLLKMMIIIIKSITFTLIVYKTQMQLRSRIYSSFFKHFSQWAAVIHILDVKMDTISYALLNVLNIKKKIIITYSKAVIHAISSYKINHNETLKDTHIHCRNKKFTIQ